MNNLNFTLNTDERYYMFYVSFSQILLSKIDKDDMVTIFDSLTGHQTICSKDQFITCIKELFQLNEDDYHKFDFSKEESQIDIVKKNPQLFSKVEYSSKGTKRLVRVDNNFMLDISSKIWRN
jgi:hypothetical protein